MPTQPSRFSRETQRDSASPDADWCVAEIAIRLAGERDAEGIARVHAAAWRAAFTFLPARFLEGMTTDAVLGMWSDNLAGPSTMFVAVEDEHVAGFLQLGADGDVGEVRALY